MGLNFDKSGKNLLPPTDGRIAIGKKGSNGYPVKLDYFIFTHQVDPKTDIAPINGPMTEEMTRLYGEKPKEIRVVLPFHHPDEVFYTSFTDWKGRKEWSCKSEDGKTAIRKQRDGSMIEVPCDYENCTFRCIPNDPYKTTCRPNGILSVWILDAPIVGGVWKFRTNAWNSVPKIQQSLETIFNIRGSLQGLEVILSIRMESQMTPDGKGGRQKQNVPIVEIKMPCSMRELVTGKGTVFGDFQEIRELAKVRGKLADKNLINEIAKELSAPPDDEDTGSSENTEPPNNSSENNVLEDKQPNSNKNVVDDDDLF